MGRRVNIGARRRVARRRPAARRSPAATPARAGPRPAAEATQGRSARWRRPSGRRQTARTPPPSELLSPPQIVNSSRNSPTSPSSIEATTMPRTRSTLPMGAHSRASGPAEEAGAARPRGAAGPAPDVPRVVGDGRDAGPLQDAEAQEHRRVRLHEVDDEAQPEIRDHNALKASPSRRTPAVGRGRRPLAVRRGDGHRPARQAPQRHDHRDEHHHLVDLRRVPRGRRRRGPCPTASTSACPTCRRRRR